MEVYPWSELSDEGRNKVMTLVEKKIEVLANVRDEVLLITSGLPARNEFIEQLLDNEKSPEEMKEDLVEILKDNTDNFLDWIADSDEKESQPKVPGLAEQPWTTLEKLLNLSFVLWCNGAEIEWQMEMMKLRQAVMTGLAMNSPQVPPAFDSPEFPPLVIIKQMNTWLKKCGFPEALRTKDDTVEENLVLTDSGFRNYLMASLHTMGFIVDHLLENGENGPVEDRDKFLAPLAEAATEVFMRLVKGCVELFEKGAKAASNATGDALYEKYKKLTGNASPSPAASSAAQSNESAIDDALIDEIKVFLAGLAPPMAEVFGRSPSCRAVLLKHPFIGETVKLRKENPRISMLYDLANTIDEEFIVIHAAEKKGYRVFVSGCSDNKLLGMALAANLIQSDAKEESLLSGSRPKSAFIDMMSSKFEQEPMIPDKYSHPWTFSTWTVVKPDGSIPPGMGGASHWIWAEGVPSQIPSWRGTRVLILQKAPFPKSFSPIRMFGGMDAVANIKKTLSSAEIDLLLKEIGSSSEESRQEAIKYHKQFQ